MTITTRQLRFWIINIGFLIGLWVGFGMEITGLMNVILFFTWICIITGVFLFADELAKKVRPRCIPEGVDILLDITIMGSFAWFGCWITAIFWFISTIATCKAHDENKERKKTDEDRKV